MNDRRYPLRPIVGVGAVIMNSEKILLIKRGKPPREGSWSLPGGAQKLGETIYEAAQREIHEETGLETEIIGLIDVVDSIRSDKKGNIEYHYTLVDVAAKISRGVLHAGSDAQDCNWFTLNDIETMDIWSETKRIIELAVTQFRTAAAEKN